jgi:hypothetical protein
MRSSSGNLASKQVLRLADSIRYSLVSVLLTGSFGECSGVCRTGMVILGTAVPRLCPPSCHGAG